VKKSSFSFRASLILGFGLSIVVGILVVITVFVLFISAQSAQREIVALTTFRNLISQEQIHVLRYISGEAESLGNFSSLHQKFLQESGKVGLFQQSPELQTVADEESELASILLSSRNELGVLDTLAIANNDFNDSFMRQQMTDIPPVVFEDLQSQRVSVDIFDPSSAERDTVVDNFRKISDAVLDTLINIEAGAEIVESQKLIRKSADDIFAARIQLSDDVLPRYANILAGTDRFLTELSSNNARRENMIFIMIVVMILVAVFIEAIIAVVSIRYASDIKGRLEMQNREIKRFTRVVTHELRTPLTIISGFAEEIQDSAKGEVKENADIIMKTARSLLDLINNLLDISKIEAGKMKITPEKFNPADSIKDVAKSISYLANQKGLKIITTIDKEVTEVYTDKPKFEQILINLINNAIKFTQKGSVTISAKERGDMLAVDIIDTGTGIKEESLRKLFREFEQVAESEKNKEGTGLGLSISRQLANILGGKLSVKSTYGKGATFTFVLPLYYNKSIADKRKVG